MKYSRGSSSSFFFWITLLLISGVLLWASLFKLDKSILADGTVSPLGRAVPVQNRFEGKVSQIHVKVGDVVEIGSELIDFDSDQERSDHNEAKLDLLRLELEERRLSAQLARLARLPRADGDDERIWSDQQRVLTSELSNLNQDLAVLEQERVLKIGSLKSLASKFDAILDNLKLSQRKKQLTDALFAKGYTGEIAVMEARQNVANIVRDQAEITLSVESIQGDIDLVERRKESKLLSFNRDAAAALLETRQTLALARYRFEASSAKLRGQALRSPVRGMVSKVAVNYVGEVARGGDTIVEIIPEGQPLVFYARLELADVDEVRAGQVALVILANMNSRTEKSLRANVLRVDPDSSRDPDTGVLFYGAIISLPNSELLIPGMTGTAALLLGERTVIEYFIEPILNALKGALSETS